MSSYNPPATTTLSHRYVSFDSHDGELLRLPLESPDFLLEEADAPGSWDLNPQIVRAPPPRCVDHTYHDYSNFPEEELPPVSKALMNFPTKLHHILSDPGNQHVSIVLEVCSHDAMHTIRPVFSCDLYIIVPCTHNRSSHGCRMAGHGRFMTRIY